MRELYNSIDRSNDEISDIHTRGVIDGWGTLLVKIGSYQHLL